MGWTEHICGTNHDGMVEAFKLLSATIDTTEYDHIDHGYYYQTRPLRETHIVMPDGRQFKLRESYQGFESWEEGDGGSHIISLEVTELDAKSSFAIHPPSTSEV